MSIEIGRIERVSLREVWPHEAIDFTRWLQDNIDVLNDTLGFSLESPEREQSAGDFKVDIVAKDGAGNLAIIENQLEKSDHDHLGKLVTYVAAFGAKVAVWIVAEPRAEHVNALTWLNQSNSASFYLLKVEAVRIGQSAAAPLLTLIVGPTEETRQVGVAIKELAEADLVHQRFWSSLLDFARARTRLLNGISPSKREWINVGLGVGGMTLNCVVRNHWADVELYIDRGRGGDRDNDTIFNFLAERKDEIERVFGEPLIWNRLEGRRACRISRRFDDGGSLDEERWPEVQEAMVDALVRLQKALEPYISQIRTMRFTSADGVEIPAADPLVPYSEERLS